jgi:hypothetical protein
MIDLETLLNRLEPLVTTDSDEEQLRQVLEQYNKQLKQNILFPLEKVINKDASFKN